MPSAPSDRHSLRSSANAAWIMSTVKRSASLSQSPSLNARNARPTRSAFRSEDGCVNHVQEPLAYHPRVLLVSELGPPLLALFVRRRTKPLDRCAQLPLENLIAHTGDPASDPEECPNERHIIERPARKERIDDTLGTIDRRVLNPVVGDYRTDDLARRSRLIVVPSGGQFVAVLKSRRRVM